MSLMGTLAKVAVGIAVAKGASALMGGRSGGGGLGGAGGLQGMLSGALGGAGGQSGGLGGLLSSMGGGGQAGGIDSLMQGQAGQGGLGAMLGNLTGGGAAAGAGGLAGMLGGLASGAQSGRTGSFGDVFNQAITSEGEPELDPTPEQDAVAGLLLRAMIQAAKADGEIDPAEQSKLMDRLGDVSAEERAFVEAEMRAPVDAAGLAQQVPQGLEPQVYSMSLMAIDLDNQAEAEYLHALATALRLGQAQVNDIHTQLGAPQLYR